MAAEELHSNCNHSKWFFSPERKSSKGFPEAVTF